MKNICKKIILIPLLLAFFDGFAQQIPILDSISFYGSFITHLAFYESNCEVQNNGSRVGLFMTQKLKNDLVFFGKTEWAVNTVENNYTFNQGAVTSESVSEGLFVQSKNAFDTRLGYFGMSFKKFGTLSIGKQWSAYYDVSGWTDMFDVFWRTSQWNLSFGNRWRWNWPRPCFQSIDLPEQIRPCKTCFTNPANR
jgi:predicted porin